MGLMHQDVPYIAYHDVNIYLRDIMVDNNWCTNQLYTRLPSYFSYKLIVIDCVIAPTFQDRCLVAKLEWFTY